MNSSSSLFPVRKFQFRTACALMALLLAAITVLAGCGSGKPADSGDSSAAESSQSEAETDSGEQKPTNTPVPKETETYSGKLTEFYYGTFVIEGDVAEKTFSRTAYTYYNLNGNNNITLGDTLEVTYHEANGANVADQVVITEHPAEEISFGGLVSDVKDEQLVVTGTEMTVKFRMDKKTAVTGTLSEGDTVEVVYTGDLSEEPYAVKVTVMSENAEPLL